MSACEIARHVYRRHYSVVCVEADALLGMCVVTHAACVTPASPDFGVYEVPHAGVTSGGTCEARCRHRARNTHAPLGAYADSLNHMGGLSSHASSHTMESLAVAHVKRDLGITHLTRRHTREARRRHRAHNTHAPLGAHMQSY